MTREQAVGVAATVAGVAYHSGGGIWLVVVTRARDGAAVVIDEDYAAEYRSFDLFFRGESPVRVVEFV